MLENMRFGCEVFNLSSVAYVTADFKKVVSDLFHASFILVELNVSREKQGYIGIKVIVPSKPFQMQYKSTMHISV